MPSYLVFKLHAVCNEYSWVLQVAPHEYRFKLSLDVAKQRLFVLMKHRQARNP